ncbi:MAG: hypothetical protein ACK5JT_06085 [Hyphomicrobiaceae bacterium]
MFYSTKLRKARLKHVSVLLKHVEQGDTCCTLELADPACRLDLASMRIAACREQEARQPRASLEPHPMVHGRQSPAVQERNRKGRRQFQNNGWKTIPPFDQGQSRRGILRPETWKSISNTEKQGISLSLCPIVIA